jgi:CHASE3 domain sensor protein
MAIRLAAPLVAVSLLLLAVGVVAAWYVHKLDRDMTSLLTHGVSSQRAAEELVIAASQIEIKLDQYLLTGDPRHLDAIPSLRAASRRSLAEAERLAGTPAERGTSTRSRGRTNGSGASSSRWAGDPGVRT